MWLEGIHNGGTELTKDFKSWNAMDASTVIGTGKFWDGCTDNFLIGFYPTCYGDDYPVGGPMGWDGAHTGPAGISMGSFRGDNYLHESNHWYNLSALGSYGHAGELHPVETALLISGLYPDKVIGRFSGLRSYQELRNVDPDATKRRQSVDSSRLASNIPIVEIEVEKKVATIMTTANMTQGAKGDITIGAKPVSLGLKDTPRSGVMRVVAGAEVYFALPEARSDGAIEWPSLFNPFWQARLRDTRNGVVSSISVQ